MLIKLNRLFLKLKLKTNNFGINVRGVTIPEVSDVNYLGISIDENGKWYLHIAHFYKKIKKRHHIVNIKNNILCIVLS